MIAAKSASTQREILPLRLLDGVTQGLNVLGSLLIMSLVLIIGADVFLRNVFGRPINGVPELVSLSIVAIVFIQIPQVLRSGRMTRAEMFSALLGRRAPGLCRLIDSLLDLSGAAVAGTIAWATWPLFVKAWTRNDFVGAVGGFTAPTWPVKLTIIVGSTMLAVQFLLRIVRRMGDRS